MRPDGIDTSEAQARPRARRGRRGAGLICACLALLLMAGGDSNPEYAIKAGFLYNFALYTTWEDSAFDDEEDELAPIVFAVLGTDPFEEHLDAITKHPIRGRKVVLHRFKDLAEFDKGPTCHVLFVGRSMEAKLDQVFARVAKRPVFTVSELHRFAETGGVARFLVESGNVRIEINIDAAARAKLKVSSQLLKLVTIIEDEDS